MSSNDTQTDAAVALSCSEVAAIVASQNDAFRKSIMQFQQAENIPKGRVVMTQGVSAQTPNFLLELTRQVVAFDAFSEDCDPHGWHCSCRRNRLVQDRPL